MSKPSAKKCREAGCEKLERVKIDTVNGPRMSNYCSVTKKIPGNMGTCPEGMY
jgi:hypothetical protein